jgi:hypothetical protein
MENLVMFNSSVTSEGFRVGVHKPTYSVANLRGHEQLAVLGVLPDGQLLDNRLNYPAGVVVEENARWIYEIGNPFPFRGATFIDSGWAAARADNPELISISPPPSCSLKNILAEHLEEKAVQQVLAALPKPLLYELAANSTDSEELVQLAENCCRMSYDAAGLPTGLVYKKTEKKVQADIDDFELFETVANNPHLPDVYKQVMVLKPGVQGASEIVGDFEKEQTHVFEYLRRNSYIPWGHFAANMADDAIHYRTTDLNTTDMQGLRRLYYQRSYVTLAAELGIDVKGKGRGLDDQELEQLRLDICAMLQETEKQSGSATLWGWNFGYGFSGSGYRLHASHQMIHQQYAMVPKTVATLDGGEMECFGCGDQVADTINRYQQEYERDFFVDYLAAIRKNTRMDGRDLPASLIIYEDESVLLFVPKAQVSQWELQLMVIADSNGQAVGNIIEADGIVRAAIDQAILLAQHIYAGLGAQMVTSLEYPKRIGVAGGQRLLYSFLPKLPWSMGAFSEGQQRYICGHFPEDFARACRRQL